MRYQALTQLLSQPVCRHYPVWAIVYTMLGIGISYVMHIGVVPAERFPAVLYCFVFPHISVSILFFLKQFVRNNTPLITIILDSINLGLLLTVCEFPIFETVMFSMLLLSTGMIRYGIRALFIILPPLFIAISISVKLLPPEPFGLMPTELSVFSMTIVALYHSLLSRQLRLKHKAFTLLKAEAAQLQDRYRELSQNLSKYLSPQVWESLFLGRRDIKIGSKRKKLTVFFSDIQGFTDLSEVLEPGVLTELLNQYLNEMSIIALEYGGTIDKFVGDSIIIFFGDHRSMGPGKDALAAVSMAMAMREKVNELRQEWVDRGISKPLEVRMGLNTGYCTVGNFGARNRMDYTVIGQDVNLASRLENAAGPGEILISHKTWSLVKNIVHCQSMGDIRVKGFSRPVATYRVMDFINKPGADHDVLEYETNGFSMTLNLDSVDRDDIRTIITKLESSARASETKTISDRKAV